MDRWTLGHMDSPSHTGPKVRSQKRPYRKTGEKGRGGRFGLSYEELPSRSRRSRDFRVYVSPSTISTHLDPDLKRFSLDKSALGRSVPTTTPKGTSRTRSGTRPRFTSEKYPTLPGKVSSYLFDVGVLDVRVGVPDRQVQPRSVRVIGQHPDRDPEKRAPTVYATERSCFPSQQRRRRRYRREPSGPRS